VSVKVPGYCGFCAVHCPVLTTVDGGRVAAVEPDRAHPFGGAICVKGLRFVLAEDL
jgi:anaerobic selenocysteine-containing dehydrogenase